MWKNWCKAKSVKSVTMGRSMYERYKNINLNKIQRSNGNAVSSQNNTSDE